MLRKVHLFGAARVEREIGGKFWFKIGKSQRVKTQRVKTSENFAEEKMIAEDISEDFSEDRRYPFYWI